MRKEARRDQKSWEQPGEQSWVNIAAVAVEPSQLRAQGRRPKGTEGQQRGPSRTWGHPLGSRGCPPMGNSWWHHPRVSIRQRGAAGVEISDSECAETVPMEERISKGSQLQPLLWVQPSSLGQGGREEANGNISVQAEDILL